MTRSEGSTGTCVWKPEMWCLYMQRKLTGSRSVFQPDHLQYTSHPLHYIKTFLEECINECRNIVSIVRKYKCERGCTKGCCAVAASLFIFQTSVSERPIIGAHKVTLELRSVSGPAKYNAYGVLCRQCVHDVGEYDRPRWRKTTRHVGIFASTSAMNPRPSWWDPSPPPRLASFPFISSGVFHME